MRVFSRQALRIALPAMALAFSLPSLAWTSAYERLPLQPDLMAPTLMFGRIRVGEIVTVQFDLLLKS